jgi:putative Holliday junction resolvase
MPQKNYLAIDYGERRVGIAFANGSVGIAFPRETIDQKEKDLWAKLEKLINDNKITDFILGMPIHPNNHPNSKQKTVEIFASELQKKFPQIELHLQDESYSSQDAAAMLSEKINGKNKGKIDSATAAVILQRFLEGNF